MSYKLKLMLMLVALISAAVLVSCGGAEKQAPEESDEVKSDVEMGELLFQGQIKADVNCASCHDADTGRAPDLSTLVTALSDEEILKVMEQGKGSMPGFSEMLMEKEQEQILQCLRARFDSEPVETTEPTSEEPTE